MGWKKVVEGKDLIVFEKDLVDSKIKIEARKSQDHGWEVFKTHIQGNSSNLISEYSLENKTQVKKLIDRLKHGQSPTPNQIKKLSKSPLRISLKRAYKEEFVEKWYFFVNSERIKNVIFVKYENVINVDLILHEKYKYYKRTIISLIEDKLGLKDLGETIKYEIYYFRNQTTTEKRTKEYDVNVIDIEWDPEEEN